jgi:hypothetical protein
MHIFIDESGSFTRPGEPAVSAVGALVVPDRRLPYLIRRYLKIRPSLPQEKGEVKGRLLSEDQVASIVALINRVDALFEVSVIDMAMHSEADIASHKAGQEHAMTSNLTAEHHENIHKEIAALRSRLEEMAHQLYIQSVLTFDVIARVLRHSTLYYAQRIPRELSAFSWIIDGKEPFRVTPWEDWWSQVVLPMLQSKFLREPMWHLKGADYSHYDRSFQAELGDHLMEFVKDKSATDATDLRKVMSHFRFSSEPEPGLELADIVTNAVRRAMMGNLQIDGWRHVPCLMIHRKFHYIAMIALTNKDAPSNPGYMPVLHHFEHGGKSLLT